MRNRPAGSLARMEFIQDPRESHRELGLTDGDVLDMYRMMLLTRRLDDRMWALNRQGRAPFVVSASGHEGTQIGTVFAMDPARDWSLPYYRDVGVVLAWGMSPLDLMLGVYAKSSDPSSGGRQLPNHWSHRAKRIFSHSSPIATQFPHACGIAHALQQQGSDAVVAVYGGEGSTSPGDWSEAMNFAGIHDLPILFIIENNGYAISVPASEEIGGHIAARAQGFGMPGVWVDGNDTLAVYKATQDAVGRARAGRGPTLIEAVTYRYYAHTSDDDDKLYRSREEVETWRRKDPLARLHQYLVEARLLTEAEEAALDAEVDATITDAVRSADEAAAPGDAHSNVYRRVIAPPPATTTPEPEPVGETVNMIGAVNRTLHDIMASQADTFVFGQDVAGEKGGVFKATVGLSAEFGDDRVFNTPLAESLIIGLAVGMAAAGANPLPEIQFADFIHPAFDQIVSEVARLNYRTDGDWHCPMVIRTPFGGGIGGGLYHSQSIESFFAHVPGLKVVVPSTPADVKGLLWSAFEDPDPVVFLEPKRLYRAGRGPYPQGEHRVPLGKAALRRTGDDITIIAYGAMAIEASEAAAELAERGIGADVIDLRTLRPLDWATIGASIEKTGRALIVHEDNGFVGYGAEIAAQIAEKSFEFLDAPVRRYAAPEIPAFPFAENLERSVMPNAAGIVERAAELAEW